MPEVTITIGGRDYAVACQEGEEPYLHSAAKLLDTEASALAGQAGRMPEARMLLMAGLMLADKTAGLEEQLRSAEARMGAQEAEMEQLRAMASGRDVPPPPAPEPERIEVPVVPEGLQEDLQSLVAQAETLAGMVDEKVAAGA